MDQAVNKIWDDVCTAHQVSPEQMPDVSWMPEFMKRPMVLFYKIGMITKAINGDWEPDYTDKSQRKYYVWCELLKDESKPAGFRLSFGGCGCVNSGAYLGARLVFENEAKAKKALALVEPLYEEWLFGIRNDMLRMTSPKQVFTREDVIGVISNMLERADAVMDAITSEDPEFEAEDFLTMAEKDLADNKLSN